jgi:hypothetical protein
MFIKRQKLNAVDIAPRGRRIERSHGSVTFFKR